MSHLRPASSPEAEALASSMYAVLFDASPDAILIADDEGRYLEANPAACRLFGTSRERLLGCRISDFSEPAQASATQGPVSASRRAASERREFRIRRPSGETLTLESVAIADFLPGRHASFLRDVTERKSRENLVLKFHALIEKSADFIGFATPDGAPLYINDAGLKMTGLRDLADAQGRRVIDFFLDEDKPFVLGTMIPAVMKIGQWQGEFRFKNLATGSAIPVYYNFFRIDDPSTGEVAGIATVTRDISEPKRQREVLEANERQFRLLTELIPQMVWTTTPDGTHLYFNKGWTDYTGLTLDQSVGWGWQDVLHPDDVERTTEVWTRSLRTGTEYQIEYRMRGKDGAYRWQLARAHPLRDPEGKILQWFGTCTDIDAQRKLQDLLRESQVATERERKRLYAIFMDAPVVIKVVRGNDLVVEFTNRLYQQLFGPDRKLIGLRFDEALPELDQSLVEIQRQVIRTGQKFEARELPATLDYDNNGKPYEKLWHAFYEPLRNEEGEVDALITFAFDVTEQVRARKQTQDFIVRLEQEREIREQFVSALTHDLRTPLFAARMSAQMTVRSPNDPDRVQKNSARVISNIDRADRMIRDLLDANLIRAGERLPIHVAVCDLDARLKETLDELSTVHGDRFELRSEGPVVGCWDSASLQRVLENLCNNAVKYGSTHEKIEVALAGSDEEVQISVRNRGNPLSYEELANLFKSFHRTAAARSSRTGGWGIGLTLVKGVAESHRGSVSVTSSPEEGTIFTLRIPKSGSAQS